MRLFDIFAFTIMIAGFAWLCAAVAFQAVFSCNRRLWARFASLLASLLLMYGASAFFGPGLVAEGGLNWLVRDSFEWPVGNTDGMVELPNGDHVVPIEHVGRVQVYDPQWKFLRGWRVDASGGAFKLNVLPPDQIEILTTRRDLRMVFTANGRLVSSDTYPVGAYNSVNNGSPTITVPTPIWLWIFTSPVYGWLAVAGGMLLLGLTDRKSARQGQRQRHEQSALPSNQGATGSAVTRKDLIPPIRQNPTAHHFSFAQYSGVSATGVWIAGWVAVACTAILHAARHVTVAAVVGISVSIVMIAVGCVGLGGSMKNSTGAFPGPAERETWTRRIVGWFAAVAWCGGAIAWNVGIFLVLLDAARNGRGWLMLVLVLWSLIGWFLLSVLFAGLTVVLDWVVGVIGRFISN